MHAIKQCVHVTTLRKRDNGIIHKTVLEHRLTVVGGARPFAMHRGSVPSLVKLSTVEEDDWRLAALDKSTITNPTNEPSGPLVRPGNLNILATSKAGSNTLIPPPPPPMLPPPPPPPPPPGITLTVSGLLWSGGS
jgi:hypothetical protein